MTDPRQPRQVEIDVEVRYAETDQMGVVHHSNYLVWFELARTRLCADSGTTYAEIEELGYYLMVTGAHLQYRGGARYGQTVKVRCWLDRLASRVVHFAYEARHGGELLVTGVTEHVWVSRSTGKHCRIPDAVRPQFESLAG